MKRKPLKISSRKKSMRKDIALHIDSRFMGYVTPETMDDFFGDYYASAMKKAYSEPWDNVILYAITEYDTSKETIYSADFMIVPVPYGRYTELASKISDGKRLFFIRGRKEWYDDDKK